MFSVTGKILKVFKTPEGKDKTGKVFGGELKIQVLGDLLLKNGEQKSELLTLTIPEAWGEKVKAWVGRDVTIPCGIFAPGGQVKTYIPENALAPSPAGIGGVGK